MAHCTMQLSFSKNGNKRFKNLEKGHFSSEDWERQVRSPAISIPAHLAFTHQPTFAPPSPPGTKIHSPQFKLTPLSPFFPSSIRQSFTITTTCTITISVTRITIGIIHIRLNCYMIKTKLTIYELLYTSF